MCHVVGALSRELSRTSRIAIHFTGTPAAIRRHTRAVHFDTLVLTSARTTPNNAAAAALNANQPASVVNARSTDLVAPSGRFARPYHGPDEWHVTHAQCFLRLHEYLQGGPKSGTADS